MTANRIWVRGVPGRLARIEPNGPYISPNAWVPTTRSHFITRKAEAGDLEISFKDPKAPKTPVAAAPAPAKPKEA